MLHFHKTNEFICIGGGGGGSTYNSMFYMIGPQGLGASEKKTKKNYIILQGGELTCFHFFKSSC